LDAVEVCSDDPDAPLAVFEAERESPPAPVPDPAEPEPEPEPELGSEPEAESDPPPESAVAAAAPSDPEPPSDPLAAAAVLERAAELRSFLAQPEPLKWIVGAVNALRTGAAPHTGQASGPSATTEWRTSNRWPFGQR
jgi:hypothetical protein